MTVEGYVKLRTVPVTFAQANEHIAAWHRHNDPIRIVAQRSLKFAVGLADAADVLRAVAIAGKPIARPLDDGATLEVWRVASDGTPNACSMLYGACIRAGMALGYRRIITYTRSDESGSSPKAAGFRVLAQRPPRPGWSHPSRPRDNTRYMSVQRQLWEKVVQ